MSQSLNEKHREVAVMLNIVRVRMTSGDILTAKDWASIQKILFEAANIAGNVSRMLACDEDCL